MKEATRNSNIELLRIVSMLMILMLHYLLFGNILSQSTAGGIAYYGSWTLEAVCLISVDCYMLISGYFPSEKQFTSRRILSFYVQILFYTLVLAVFCFSLGIADLNIANLIQIIPVLGGRNWYVTAYFCLLFLSPVLNHVVQSMEKKGSRLCLSHSLSSFRFCIHFSFLPTHFVWKADIRSGGTVLYICWERIIANMTSE